MAVKKATAKKATRAKRGTFVGQPATSSVLDEFRQQAEQQATRIPSATITVADGQYVCGRVIKRGVHRHPSFGDSPVIVFDPDEQDTNVAATFAGTPISELDGEAYVFVGVGTVAKKLHHIRQGDYLYILGLPPGESPLGTYDNYEFVVKRGDGDPVPIDTLIADTQLAQAVPTPSPSSTEVDRDEEPF